MSLLRTNPMIPFKGSTGFLRLVTAPVHRAVLLHTPPPKTHHHSGPAWSSPRYRHIQRASGAEPPVGLSFRFDRLPSHFSHPARRYSTRPRDHRHHKSGPCVSNSPSPPADASTGITPSHTGPTCRHSDSFTPHSCSRRTGRMHQIPFSDQSTSTESSQHQYRYHILSPDQHQLPSVLCPTGASARH